MWFHWDGREIVLATPGTAPKVKALEARPEVALSIDTTSWPHHVLLVRGTASVEHMAHIVPEYALAAERYFGPEQGRAWVEQAAGMFDDWARIAVIPQEARVIDFETRFPSAIAKAMAAQA